LSFAIVVFLLPLEAIPMSPSFEEAERVHDAPDPLS
jgi:hypothetical protein